MKSTGDTCSPSHRKIKKGEKRIEKVVHLKIFKPYLLNPTFSTNFM